MQRLTEDRLKQTEAGRNYLYGLEAQNVREQLQREDAEARQKAADAKKVTEMESRTKNNPLIKAAEVSAEKIQEDEGKRKAAEIMAFQAKQEAAVKNTPRLMKAAELEDEKKKQQARGLGDDYGMG